MQPCLTAARHGRAQDTPQPPCSPCSDPNRLQFYSIGGSVRTTWIFRTASNTQNLVARPGVTPQVSIQVSASAPF
jgi:hypothetical protein